MGHTGNLVNPPAPFQHIPGDAAAPVPKTIGDQQVLVHIFFCIGIPYALNGFGDQLPVVGVKPASRLAVHCGGGDKMGEHAAPVNSLPVKGVMGHPVILVPADLGGHKHINTGFTQNLGQCPGIAKHIRQPEEMYVPAKFFLDELASYENLACQGFPAGKVTVRFHPHGAVRFPPSLGYTLFDLLIQLREIFLNESVKLGLGL